MSGSSKTLKSARRRMLKQTWNAVIKKMFPNRKADQSDIDLAFIPNFGQLDDGDMNLGNRPKSRTVPTKKESQESSDFSPPLYWDDIIRRDHYHGLTIPLDTHRSLKLLLCASHELLGIQYAPILPDVTALLLDIMPDSYVYATLRTMIRHPRQKYFATSRDEHLQFCKDFARFFRTLHPQNAALLETFDLLSPDALSPIFNRFFVTVFRNEHLLELTNLFIVDHVKLLFRLATALFSTCITDFGLRIEDIPTSGKDKAAEFLWQAIRSYTFGSEFNLDQLLSKAYSFHDNWFIVASLKGFYEKDLSLYSAWSNVLSTVDRFSSTASLFSFTNGEQKGFNREWAARQLALRETSDEMAELVNILEDIEPIPILSGLKDYWGQPVPTVLGMTSSFRFHISRWLPASMQTCKLQMIYSSTIMGNTLQTFYDCLQSVKESLVLLEVLNSGVVIGMYASQKWCVHTRPYGDGQCFLFRASPNPVCYKWKHSPMNNVELACPSSSPKITNNQALAEQFMVARSNCIAMGGSEDGGFGLYLSADLSKGSSTKAVGFDNDPLAGEHQKEFDVGLVEVYRFVKETDPVSNSQVSCQHLHVLADPPCLKT